MFSCVWVTTPLLQGTQCCFLSPATLSYQLGVGVRKYNLGTCHCHLLLPNPGWCKCVEARPTGRLCSLGMWASVSKTVLLSESLSPLGRCMGSGRRGLTAQRTRSVQQTPSHPMPQLESCVGSLESLCFARGLAPPPSHLPGCWWRS